MSIFASLASDASINPEKDTVGGGSNFGPLESDLYPAKVAMAYVKTAASGAMALEVVLTMGGKEVKQTLWMTSGTAKGGKNYYEKGGEKFFLPGFLQANALCVLTCGQEISAMDTEEKVIKIYSYDAKAEVPTKAQVVMDLIGKDILVGLCKQTVDKNIKNAAGAYVPSGDTRDENEIDKLFHADSRMTTTEIKAGADDAAFVETWLKKWKGVTKNKATGTAGAAGTAGAPSIPKKPAVSLFATPAAAPAPAVNKPAKSLFAA